MCTRVRAYARQSWRLVSGRRDVLAPVKRRPRGGCVFDAKYNYVRCAQCICTAARQRWWRGWRRRLQLPPPKNLIRIATTVIAAGTDCDCRRCRFSIYSNNIFKNSAITSSHSAWTWFVYRCRANLRRAALHCILEN